MNAEQYLKRIKTLQRKIRNKKCRLKQYDDRYTPKSVSYDQERVQSTHKNLNENASINAIDLEMEIKAHEKELAEIESTLNLLAEIDADAYFVLYQIYVLHKAYKQIAAEADNKSASWVSNKRRTGLNSLDEILRSDNEKRI